MDKFSNNLNKILESSYTSMQYTISEKYLMKLVKHCEELMQHDDVNVRRTAATMRNTLTHDVKPVAKQSRNSWPQG